MLYGEIIAVCSQIHINTLCGQNVELLNVKPGGTQSEHCALKCLKVIGYILSCILVTRHKHTLFCCIFRPP